MLTLAKLEDIALSGEADVLAPAGHYNRRPPSLLEIEKADPEVLVMVRRYAAVTRQNHPAILRVALPEAEVVGQGAVITMTGELLIDTVAEFLANGLSPEGFTSSGNGYTPLAPVTHREEAPSLLLKRPWYRNYGHWLVDAAALLALRAESGTPLPQKIIIGTPPNAQMAAVMHDTCKRLAPNAEIVEHPDGERWSFRRLEVVTPVHVPPLFKLPAALDSLRRAFECADLPEPRRRLFLPRRNGVRHLTNNAEISALLARYGFEEAYPETMTLAEQAALFQEARMVVGIKGAALTNILFAGEACKIVVLSPSDFADPFFWDIAGQRCLQYAEVFGDTETVRSVARNNFTIATTSLEHALFGEP